MNDAYPEGYPRYASRAQTKGEEDDAEAEPVLPACNGKNGPGCIKKKANHCKNNVLPKVQDGEEVSCTIQPLCAENPGMAAGIDCYAPGVTALSQHKGEEDDAEAEPVLPACNGSNGPGCIKKKAKHCPKNVLPKLQDGEEANCTIQPLCAENPGMAAGIDCFAPGVTALLQTGSTHRHHHHHSHKVHNEEDDAEAEPVLPTCNGKNGPGCIKRKANHCKNNVLPKVQDGEEVSCTIQPLCAENPGMAAGIDCFAPGVTALSQHYAPGGSSLAQHTIRHKHHHRHHHTG